MKLEIQLASGLKESRANLRGKSREGNSCTVGSTR